MKTTLRIRFRIDFSGHCSVGPGKIELLNAIAESGSLSQAARDMGMSYRRAWLLMDSLNKGFNTPVVSANIGGSGGGGAAITEFGRQLMEAYQQLEKHLLISAARHMRNVESHVTSSASKIKAADIKRRRVTSGRRGVLKKKATMG